MITLRDAQSYVLSLITPLAEENVALEDALGLTLSEEVRALDDVPSFPNSSMDGYALRASDARSPGATLHVVGTLEAGHVYGGALGAREAVRIMTGAPLPDGADAVAVIERCEVNETASTVRVLDVVRQGDFVRLPGVDVRRGQVLAECATVLRPAHLGLFAAQGLRRVSVHRRARVGVLSTGDELFEGEGPLPPGKIRDANRHALLGLVRNEGFDALDLGVVGDRRDDLRDAFARAERSCDALVTSGGVSVGDADVVRLVLQEIGDNTVRWMQVAIRPAKPFAFGLIGASKLPVFGLPGNPVSALVSFELLVRAALRKMSGHRELFRAPVLARASAEYALSPDERVHYVRALVTLDDEGRHHVTPLEGQESHQLRTMADANAFIVLAHGRGFKEGDLVTTLVVGAVNASAPDVPEPVAIGVP